MRNSLIMSFLALVFSASCQKKSVEPETVAMTSPTPTTPDTPEDKTKTFTYLALGDSYTIGESVEIMDRYPNLIVSELDKQGFKGTDTIIARTGWTTQNLKTAIQQAKIDNIRFDIVSLLIGVNNQYQRRSVDEYKTQFKELLATAIIFANNNKAKVFVISIPDYGYTPFGESNQQAISDKIDLFNEANKRITDSMGIKYFDITPISRQGLDEPNLVASDGLHPSGIQYQKWTNLMLEDIKQIIIK